ncbi:MAG TPA: hypothetical protein VMT03_21445 [Polyangia bacterium]|nr:hypothetical protein [Polyangia bacterium]
MSKAGAALLAAWLAVAGAAGGCGGRDEASSPEDAVRALIATARAGDRAAVYARLGPRTRARIEALLVSGHRSGGARLLTPQDLLAVGWLPPAWEATGTRLVALEGNEADVEVFSATGDRQTVRAVREGRGWRVELPLR